jgi:hypothetical protein
LLRKRHYWLFAPKLRIPQNYFTLDLHCEKLFETSRLRALIFIYFYC